MRANDDPLNVRMRRANEADCMDLFRWRNDPIMRRNSISGDAEVSLEDHKRWFAKKMKDPRSKLYIGIAGDRKVGMVRFDAGEDCAVISVSVDPAYRGMGLGSKMVGLTSAGALREFGKPIVARIKSDNMASIRIFAKNGYNIKDSANGVTCMCFDGKSHE
ncbi:MAG: GNAT family N-acetyltransferase [Candidatus Omnitrophica bacterium]|nr:GNAT family N-acetyltransferase [Candidatus Omnitrophota bacterium]